MREIYLDNSASTPVAPEVLEAMLPYLNEYYGNPSSRHKKGIETERAIKEGRQIVADALHVKSSEVFFTSGATEADNFAIKGAAHALKRHGMHIVTQKTEHEAVIESCHALEKDGFELTYLDTDEYGNINKEELVNAVREDTTLVAIMHVNNELGTVHPINEYAEAVKLKNPKTLFFSDGVQAVGKLDVDLENIDMYSFSGHKIHGPKGIGAIVVKEGVNIEPVLHGGGQERGLRSGTENVPGIVGLSEAVKISYENLEINSKKMKELQEEFIRTLKEVPDVRINSPKDGLLNIVNIAFKGIPSEILLHAIEERGIFASSGSACGAGKQEISHVLEAINIPYEYAVSSLRFSFSRYNTEEEIIYTCKTLKEIIPNLRNVVARM
ncbi:MAG: cysteine desulfurase family protein [Candidatus Spechtbacterales bacterium]